jgi:hypothetical protein
MQAQDPCAVSAAFGGNNPKLLKTGVMVWHWVPCTTA